MSTRLGVSNYIHTLDEPFSCDVGSEIIGETRRMADGSLKRDYVATKNSWRVGWRTLALGGSQSGRTEIKENSLDQTGELTWSPPDTITTYTVLCMGYSETLVNIGGEEYYDVQIVLVEV